MLRLLPILGAFALGAAFSWWVVSPTVVVRQDLSVTAAEESESAIVGEVEVEPDHALGSPPSSVTLPKSHLSAGQKRALNRALRELEKNPPEIPTRDVDPARRAAMLDSIRAGLGDQP